MRSSRTWSVWHLIHTHSMIALMITSWDKIKTEGKTRIAHSKYCTRPTLPWDYHFVYFQGNRDMAGIYLLSLGVTQNLKLLFWAISLQPSLQPVSKQGLCDPNNIAFVNCLPCSSSLSFMPLGKKSQKLEILKRGQEGSEPEQRSWITHIPIN